MSTIFDKMKNRFYKSKESEEKAISVTTDKNEVASRKKSSMFESPSVSPVKTQRQEINDAIKRYKDLEVAQERIYDKEDELFEEEVFSKLDFRKIEKPHDRNLGRVFINLIRNDYYGKIYDRIEEIFEEDTSILDSDKESQLIEKIADGYEKESSKKLFETLKERLIKDIDGKYMTLNNGVSFDEITNGMIKAIIGEIKYDIKIKSQIIPEKIGIKAALLRSLNSDVLLPEDLHEKQEYEDKDDFIKKQKDDIVGDLESCINNTSFTKTESEFKKDYLRKVILEATALMGDDTLDNIKNMHEQDIEEGKVNPNASKLERIRGSKVLEFFKQGYDKISKNNRSNKTFIYYDKDKKQTIFADGEVKEQEHDKDDNTI